MHNRKFITRGWINNCLRGFPPRPGALEEQDARNWRHRHHPPGTKLLRRFIRASEGEQVAYRRTYLALTGRSDP